MSTSLADPPAAPGAQQQPPAPAGAAADAAGAGPQRRCANCGAPMDPRQDWCLQCGAGVPGSVQGDSRQWRSAAVVVSAAALLVAGAAAAAYAALNKSTPKPRVMVKALAQGPGAGAGAPGTAAVPPPAATATPTPAVPKLRAGVKPPAPLVKAPQPPVAHPIKPPATTPAATTPAATTPTASTKKSTGGGSTGSAEKQLAAIVLDTNAASTYNPYAYPASKFGDPSLAIDGETSTGWTDRVDPAVAPRMAEGLLIDLKNAQRLSALVLTTSTPGMTVQVYGSAAGSAPASITDPAWVRLSGVLVDKKRSQRIRLADSTRAFRFVTLWISAAPASAVGTAERPGHVSVNELELFPAR